ncbi:hypothetical protein [Aeromonas sp. R3-1]|uniref:hypothetical protein n=1 Tax=Aeromonas sp. R3-1 TaxID=3138463 RepID=UPI0034A4272A
MKMYIQVVIYEKNMRDSLTLQTLLSQRMPIYNEHLNFTLYIDDNSPESKLDEVFLECLRKKYSVSYVHDPTNRTLREIYNERISNLNEEEFLLLLDDDTCLPKAYLADFLRAYGDCKEINLFLPQVQAGGGLYSPYYSYVFFSRKLKKVKVGINSSKHIAAINSGMIIRGAFFIKSGFRYPDIVDFYGTDTVFSHEFSKYENSYFLLDSVLVHDISNHPSNNSVGQYSSILYKVNVFWFRFLKERPLLLFLYAIYMFFYSVKMAMKFKNFIFIKHAIKLLTK